jgi:antitoxin HigA-1
MPGRKLTPLHLGEVLLADFLKPFELSQYRLAHDSCVPPRRINEIIHGKRAITAETALRLARYFGTTERFWLNLQVRYDLEIERDRLGDRLEQEVAVHDQGQLPVGRAPINRVRRRGKFRNVRGKCLAEGRSRLPNVNRAGACHKGRVGNARSRPLQIMFRQRQ